MSMIGNNPGTPSPGGGSDIVYNIRVGYDSKSRAAFDQASRDIKALEDRFKAIEDRWNRGPMGPGGGGGPGGGSSGPGGSRGPNWDAGFNRMAKGLKTAVDEQEKQWDRMGKAQEVAARGTEKSIQQQVRQWRAIEAQARSSISQIGAGAEQLGRSMVLLGLVNEDSLEAGIRYWAKFEAGVNLARGAIDIIRGLSAAQKAYTAATLAGAAANQAFAASQVGAGVSGLGGAATAAGAGALGRYAGLSAFGKVGAGLAAFGASAAALPTAAVLAGVGVAGAGVTGVEALTGRTGQGSLTNWIDNKTGGGSKMLGLAQWAQEHPMLSSVAFMGMPQSGWNWIAGSSAADAKSYGKTQAYVSNLSAAEQSRAALLDRQRPLEMSAFSGQLTSLGMNARSQQIGRMGYVGPEADLASVQAQRSAVSGARQMQLDRTGVGGQVDRDDAQQRHLSLVQQEIGLRREEQTLMQQISDKALSTERDRLTSAHEYTQTLKQQLDTLARAEQSGMEGFAMSGPGRQGLILKAAQQLANDPTKLSRSQIEMLGPFRGMMGPEAQQQYQSAFAAKAPGFAQLGALLGFGGMQQGLLDQLSGAQGFERVIESQMENIKAAAEKSSEKMAKKVSELMIEMFDAMANKADVNLSQERERNSRRRRTMAAAAKFYGFD